jgi:hypothetical protein
MRKKQRQKGEEKHIRDEDVELDEDVLEDQY